MTDSESLCSLSMHGESGLGRYEESILTLDFPCGSGQEKKASTDDSVNGLLVPPSAFGFLEKLYGHISFEKEVSTSDIFYLCF